MWLSEIFQFWFLYFCTFGQSIVSALSLCKKESQVKSKKMAFRQEKSRKSQKILTFCWLFLTKSHFFNFTWLSFLWSVISHKSSNMSQQSYHTVESDRNTPDVINCKVYPMTQVEDKAMEEFIKEQHAKDTYNHQSHHTSPLTSYFFIKKRDGKL